MKNCYTVKVSKYQAGIADLCLYYKGLIITRINVPIEYRGQGYGSQLLSRIIKDADKSNTTLYLEIAPSGHLSYAELEAWYKRHGFTGSMLLTRKPQGD